MKETQRELRQITRMDNVHSENVISRFVPHFRKECSITDEKRSGTHPNVVNPRNLAAVSDSVNRSPNSQSAADRHSSRCRGPPCTESFATGYNSMLIRSSWFKNYSVITAKGHLPARGHFRACSQAPGRQTASDSSCLIRHTSIMALLLRQPRRHRRYTVHREKYRYMLQTEVKPHVEQLRAEEGRKYGSSRIGHGHTSCHTAHETMGHEADLWQTHHL